MFDEENLQLSADLMNLLHQVSALNNEAEQALFAHQATEASPEMDTELLYMLPSMGQDLHYAARMIPATVLFVDIRNFTSLVESNPPSQIVRQLNEYFSAMSRILVEHGAVIDKYMGDEIMAYFEATTPEEFHVATHQAVCAAVRMVEGLDVLNRRWQAQGLPTLKNGIGINSGEVLKGNIGSMIKMETTIIGDTVNVASRLQTLSKETNTRMLISESTFHLVQGQFPVRSLGTLPIRGKQQQIPVYEVDIPISLQWLTKDTTDPGAQQASA